MRTVHADWRSQKKSTSAASAGTNPINAIKGFTGQSVVPLYFSYLSSLDTCQRKGRIRESQNYNKSQESFSPIYCLVIKYPKFMPARNSLSLSQEQAVHPGNSNSQKSLLELKQELIHWLNKNVSNANNMTHASCFYIKMNKLGHPSPYAKKSQKYF